MTVVIAEHSYGCARCKRTIGVGSDCVEIPDPPFGLDAGTWIKAGGTLEVLRYHVHCKP